MMPGNQFMSLMQPGGVRKALPGMAWKGVQAATQAVRRNRLKKGKDPYVFGKLGRGVSKLVGAKPLAMTTEVSTNNSSNVQSIHGVETIFELKPSNGNFAQTYFGFNAQNEYTWPRLSLICAQYRRVEIKQLKFIYVSSCAATTNGQVAMAVVSDPKTTELGAFDLYQTEAVNSHGQLYDTITMVAGPSALNAAVKKLFVRSGDPSGDTTSAGNLLVAWTGSSVTGGATAVGRVQIEYMIEASEPVTNLDYGTSTQLVTHTTLGGFGALPQGPVFVESDGTFYKRTQRAILGIIITDADALPPVITLGEDLLPVTSVAGRVFFFVMPYGYADGDIDIGNMGASIVAFSLHPVTSLFAKNLDLPAGPLSTGALAAERIGIAPPSGLSTTTTASKSS